MKKNIFVLLYAMIFCQVIEAQSVSVSEALSVAENFLKNNVGAQDNRADPNTDKEIIVIGDTNNPEMYAVTIGNNWVLVAGDKRLKPILAYSDINGGIFPSDDEMPPAMLDMLEWYKLQIGYVRHDTITYFTQAEWSQIERITNNITRDVIVSPLLVRNGHENKWGQSGNNGGNSIEKSYNKFCPPIHNDSVNCNHTKVGCVAVATSQVMWYWQWPYAAIVEDDSGNKLLRKYDWDLIPAQLTDDSTLNQANMTATLLHDVGVAVDMNYGCSKSSALPSLIVLAMTSGYYYSTSNLIDRSSYSDSQWLLLLKNELNNGRPILYGGFSSAEGHRFVLDGYNTNNYFHVNIGWCGSYNGYYLLDLIGHASNPYCTNQTAIINIHPNYPSCTAMTVQQSDISGTNFIVQNGGPITIGNKTIVNGQSGAIFSGECVNLTEGFTIELGANVIIDIKDMGCE